MRREASDGVDARRLFASLLSEGIRRLERDAVRFADGVVCLTVGVRDELGASGNNRERTGS